jgi:hypothetical protein
MVTRFFSRTGVVIWIAATFGTICVLPYVLALVPVGHSGSLHSLSPALVIASVAQSSLFLGFMTFTGLWAARALGKGAPLVDAWCRGEPAPAGTGRYALIAAVSGFVSGFVLLALDVGVFLLLSPSAVGQLLLVRQPPAWAGFLGSFEGGITEEVELRLFLLSFLALGFRFVYRRVVTRPDVPLAPALFWAANLVAALLFGLGHLPTTAQLVALTPVVVARALVLNGIVGLTAGALFWSYGIEMAMLCHFTADLVLHVVAPLCQAFLLSLVR